MSQELELDDYTVGDIETNGLAKTSILNIPTYIDSIAFDSHYEGVPAGQIIFGGQAIKKSSYGDNTAGIWQGIDTDGLSKVYMGDTTNSLKWTGTALEIVGEITSTSGTIGGWTIGATTITGGDVTLDSSGFISVTALVGSFKIDENGLVFYVSTTENASMSLSSGSSPMSGATLRFDVGGRTANSIALDFVWTSNNTGKLIPVTGDTIDFGDSSQYFNEINYKTLTDRGCLGSFDEGVELQDGSKVTDIEAIEAIKIEPKELTIYGVPKFDYSSMPKAVYKPAPIAKEDIYDKENPKKLLWKKGDKIGTDGAETTALISIMLGAIKELSKRVKLLEAEVDKLKQ